MTNEERYKKYIKENCSNCKHREENLCEIRIFAYEDTIITRCIYYERDKQLQGYKKPLYRTANVGHTVMPKLISDWSGM